MGGCSAFNCANHSDKGHRMVRFPRDPERRRKWVQNCRRQNWEAGPQAQLCIAHFEDSQFESISIDGKRKLRQSAVPTLFDVPNKPATLTPKRIKGFGIPKPNSILEKKIHKKENSDPSVDEAQEKIRELEEEVQKLKAEIMKKDEALSSFLIADQIKCLYKENHVISKWSDQAIIKGLKLRFALGKHGYNYLRETGYPIPSYSTLNRHIQHINLDYGILKNLLSPLQAKVESMKDSDKNCCILYDEMEIDNVHAFDTSTKTFTGSITLGDTNSSTAAKHYLVAMLRGLQSPWKQVIAHELTGPSTSGDAMLKFLSAIINAATEIGLKVRASTSDMGSCNRALWRSLGVIVKKNERQTSYTVENVNENVHAVADVQHLLKNLKGALLTKCIILPESVCTEHNLPCRKVSGDCIKYLWLLELSSPNSLRSLYHLNRRHLFPSHFQSMNVGDAVRLFSIKTAAAVEKAVSLQQVNKDALSTAWWIRLINQWFELMSARHSKVGITKKNKEEKFQFLNYFIDVIQNTQFDNSWKPYQTGLILSSLSVMNLSAELFLDGFSFFLPGRLSQDALENVFSQVRRRSAKKPNALQAKEALKIICISQFISDIKNSSYASDSDFHLLDKSLEIKNSDSISNNQKSSITATASYDFPQVASTSSASASPLLLAAEENDVYFIAGAVLNSLMKRKNVCQICFEALKTVKNVEEPDVPAYKKLFTEYSDMGGLKRPESGLYHICVESEKVFKKCNNHLLANEITIRGHLIKIIKDNCKHVILPSCCDIKERIIENYLVIRCKGLINFNLNKRAPEACYASASVNKKQKM